MELEWPDLQTSERNQGSLSLERSNQALPRSRGSGVFLGEISGHTLDLEFVLVRNVNRTVDQVEPHPHKVEDLCRDKFRLLQVDEETQMLADGHKSLCPLPWSVHLPTSRLDTGTE